MTPADRLREIMRSAPGTVTAKAAAAGVSRVYWQRLIQSDQPQEPSLEVAARIVKSLGVKLADLDDPA